MTPCSICAFFGHPKAEYHPKPGSLLAEVLHGVIAGVRVPMIGELTCRSDAEVRVAFSELRRKGALPDPGARGRPRLAA